MEIKLNLIPPLHKEKIRKFYLLLLLTRWQVEIFLLLLVFLALLWHLDYVLKIETAANLQQLEMSRQSFSYQDMQDYREKIKIANAKVEQVKKIQKGQLYWSVLLEKLNQIIFAGIKINNLSTKNYQVFLTGVADNRDNLVSFKEKLTAESCFSEVDFPLANLMNKENTVFQIQFKIKKECLKIIR